VPIVEPTLPPSETADPDHAAGQERYVVAPELAKLMGVSTSTIERFIAAGMPSETRGMGRTRRFPPSQAMTWARTRETRRG
jgi:excisionase family DNA binding protein